MSCAAVLQAMNYFDLHCDALTCSGVACVTKAALLRGGCALQCFAAFISQKTGRFQKAVSLAEKFDKLCLENGYLPVRSAQDLSENSGKIKAMLTVEGGGAIEGDLEKLEILHARGVRLMTLTWNDPNELGFPCFSDYDAWARGERGEASFERERGLTHFGREAVERMCALNIGVDVSHGSGKLVKDAAEICKANGKPVFATHSNANAVYPCPRNLGDEEIRLIADSGGVVGLCCCAEFLSDDKTKNSQKEAFYAHARHIIDVGGEDCLALGTDFDGIKPNPYIQSPIDMPLLLGDFQEKFSARIAEKIAYKNSLRAFSLLFS